MSMSATHTSTSNRLARLDRQDGRRPGRQDGRTLDRQDGRKLDRQGGRMPGGQGGRTLGRRQAVGDVPTIFDENLNLLKNQYPAFFTAVISPDFSNPELEINELPSQPGNYSLGYGDNLLNLHSAYDIDHEMEELFANLPATDEENQVILIFGLGYGHCLDYIKKKRIKYKRVIIFEPYNNIIQEVLKKRTIKELLGRRNVYVHLFKLPNEMASLLIQETMSSRNVTILFHIAYRTLYKDLYDNVLRTFIAEKNSLNTSIATFDYFLREWTENQLLSIQKQDQRASMFYKKFKNVPGIIAAAGPSLEKHFRKLRDVYDKAVIVSPGTASKILNSQNIQSHISMSIDSQKHQADIYNDFQLNSVLVGSYRLSPEVSERFPNKVFRVALNTEFLAKYYNEWAGMNVDSIDDHASVASSAIDLLYNMGCNPIILLGQDLCYYDNRLYAGASANSLSGKYVNSKLEDIDIHGEKVFTNTGFKAMQNDIETIGIRYQPSIKMYNATEGGLNIHGIENVTFDYVIDKYIKDNPYNVPEIFKSIFMKIDGTNASVDETNSSVDTVNGDIDIPSITIDNASDSIDETNVSVDETNVSIDTVNGAVDETSVDGTNVSNNGVVRSKTTASDITNFFKHVLEECNKVEKIINEKEDVFNRFEKLKSRGVARNRLNHEMAYIVSFNKRLIDIKFYKQVLYNSVQQQLTYHKAGANYISDSGEDYEGAEVYEKTLDAVILGYVNTIKILTTSNLIGEDILKGIERVVNG